jgi:hypothetical protein
MRHFSLRRLLKSKHGLSAPVGNLIILVAAVLLASVVVVFAFNLTSSQVQKEKMYVATSHIWYVNATNSMAALGISDTGPTDIVLSQIAVNGVQCQWNGTDNYVIYAEINGTIPGDLPLENITNVGSTTIPIGDQNYTFTAASQGLTIKSEWSVVFYINIPNCLSIYNLSQAVQITITTAQGVYFTETLVQST